MIFSPHLWLKNYHDNFGLENAEDGKGLGMEEEPRVSACVRGKAGRAWEAEGQEKPTPAYFFDAEDCAMIIAQNFLINCYDCKVFSKIKLHDV